MSQATDFERYPLFMAGDHGYAIYRIPGMVTLPTGSLLVYCEARRSASGDWGETDLFLRRSVDRGKTWAVPQKMNCLGERIPKNPAALAQRLASAEGQTCNNPVAIADREMGVAHFVHCVEYAHCFYMRSNDDASTWSSPVEITSAFEELRPRYDWRVISTGPGHGIQLSNGRLLIPVWLSTGAGGHAHRPSAASTIFSDDGGTTWHAGEIIVSDGPVFANPSEAEAVQLADGRVMINLRTETAGNRRVISTSPDGAEDWNEPVFDEALFEPVCFASFQRLSLLPRNRRNRLLFSNPDSRQSREPHQPWGAWKRENLTVRLSYDEGQSWPVAKVVDPGLAGYSDLAVGLDGMIYCAYEGGGQNGNYFANTHISAACFNLAWLSDGMDIDL